MMRKLLRLAVPAALFAAVSAGPGAGAAELCHSATVGQGRTPLKFCVDPETARVTRYVASGVWTERFDQRRTQDTLEGVLTLRAGRLDPPLRVTSKFLLQDLPNPTPTLGQKGQAAYQVCSWDVMTDKSCAGQDPVRGPARCWKRCSGWYGYLPGRETID